MLSKRWAERADLNHERHTQDLYQETTGSSGRRFLAVHWDTKLPPEEAAEKAGAPVAMDEHRDNADHA